MGWPKMAPFLYAFIILPNINRFSKLFHIQNHPKICNNIVTKDITTPQVCLCTTLWNISVLKATIENKTTSVTTLCPIHTADADETKLSSLVASASAVCTWIRDDCRRIQRCERTTQPYGSRLPTGVFTPTTRRNCRQLVANSCTHRRRDETRQFRLVGVGGVYWALSRVFGSVAVLVTHTT